MRLILLLVVGCSATSASSAPTAESSEGGSSEAGSDHRVGDVVAYEYAGSYADEATRLREEIADADGLRLVIEVTADRGADVRRQWIQVVTDTEENRANNVVDELYIVENGERRRLANEGNADLMQLYGWTLPDCQAPAEPLPSETRTIDVAGESFECECERLRIQCGGSPSTMTTCECPDFIWGHAWGEVTREGDAEPYWSVRVVEHHRGE